MCPVILKSQRSQNRAPATQAAVAVTQAVRQDLPPSLPSPGALPAPGNHAPDHRPKSLQVALPQANQRPPTPSPGRIPATSLAVRCGKHHGRGHATNRRAVEGAPPRKDQLHCVPLHDTPSGNRGRGQLGVPRFRPSPSSVRPQPSGCALASFARGLVAARALRNELNPTPSPAIVSVVPVLNREANPIMNQGALGQLVR